MAEDTQSWQAYGAAIIGNYRGVGTNLVGAFRRHPRLQLVGGFEPDAVRGRELSNAMSVALYSDFEQVFQDPSVKIVAIASAPSGKAMWVERAAKAGKHILLTKPMCDSLDSARKILWALESNPVKCVHDIPMVRFNPPFARLLDRARKGYLGKIFSYYHSFGLNYATDFDIGRRYPECLETPDVTGGGEMVNLGCYAVDFAVALLGRPRRVEATWQHEWRAYKKADVEHFGQIVLDYGSFYATLAVGRLQLKGRFNHSNMLHLVAQHRTILIDSYNSLVIRNNIPVTWTHYMRDFKAETALDQLITCMDEDTEPESSMEVAADGMEVLMAAYRSILDETSVSLPLGDGHNPLRKGDAHT